MTLLSEASLITANATTAVVGSVPHLGMIAILQPNFRSTAHYKGGPYYVNVTCVRLVWTSLPPLEWGFVR